MGKKITWLHLSDLRFGSKDPIDSKIIYDTLLGDIKNNKVHIDLIFVTGDITYCGAVAEYKMAGDFFEVNCKARFPFVI